MEILNLKQTKSKIASIKGRSKTMVQDIHLAALGCLNHAEKDGQFTPMTQLYAAVSNGHKTGLVLWFKQFGPVKFDRKAKKFTKVKSDGARKFDIEGAQKVSPDQIDRELHANTTVFDETKQLQYVANYLRKQAKKAAESGSTKNEQRLLKLVKGLPAKAA